jgi:hypothetical protein
MLIKDVKENMQYWHVDRDAVVKSVIVLEKHETACKVKCHPFTWMALYEDLFLTEEAAKVANVNRIESRRKKIASEINTTEDLLHMMLMAMYAEEYTDYDKIYVAKQKAKELLGIDLRDF